MLDSSKQSFHVHVMRQRDAIVGAMNRALAEHVPAYVATAENLGESLLQELENVVGLALQAIGAGRPMEDHLSYFEDLGYRSGLNGVDAAHLRSAMNVAHIAALRQITGGAGVATSAEILDLIAPAARSHHRIVQAATDACTLGLQDSGSRERRAHQLLVKQLLHGELFSSSAPSPGGYLVILLRVVQQTGTKAEQTGSLVGEILRSVPGALWQHQSLREHILLMPVDDDIADARSLAQDSVANMIRAVDEGAYAVEVHAPTVADIPAAFEEAQDALTLAAAIPDGRRRLYRSDELLVELAVLRQPALRERLAHLLSPLQRGSDLQRTVEVLFDCELDRERATRALHVHRRTLTHRLRRVRELTGLDLSTAQGIQILRMSLTALRLSSQDYGEWAVSNGS